MSEQGLKETGALAGRESSRSQRKYSAKDRKRLLRLFESRQVSQKQFARDQGIPISTLSYLVRQSARESAAAQVEVVEIPGSKWVAAGGGQAIRQPSLDCVEVRLPNQLELRVSDATDAQWVVELLRGLLLCSG